MSNFQIHELTSGTIDRDSNVIHDTLNGGNYETRKATAGAVADLANVNVAAPYDPDTTYAIGRQYCLYEGDVYRCIAITTGAFDSTAWTKIVVTGEFRRVVELTSAQYTALSSAEKNNGTLYIITDEETTAADIPYTSGVSVADKLDSLSTVTKSSGVYTVTTMGSDNPLTFIDTPYITYFTGYFRAGANIAANTKLFDLPVNTTIPLYFMCFRGTQFIRTMIDHTTGGYYTLDAISQNDWVNICGYIIKT